MGQIPKVNGYYEWNLWLICNKKICMKRHFDTYCGDGIALYESLQLKENLRREPYEFSLEFDTVVQKVSFDDDQFHFDQSAINKVKSTIENRDPKYDYTSINLKIINPIIPLRKDARGAYNNSKKELLDSLKNNIYKDIQVQTIDTVDLSYFNKLIAQNEDSALMNLPYNQLIDSLKQAKFGKKYIEDDWANRYAEIEFIHSKDTLKHLLGELREHLHYAVKHDTLEDHKVLETEQIQHYLFQYIERNELDPKILLEMNHIATRPELARVINNQAWYEYEVIDPTHEDEVILKDAYKKFKYVALDSIATAPIYRYNHFAFSINHWEKKTYDRAYRSGKIRAAFKELKRDTNIKDIDHIERVYDLKAAHYYAQFPDNSKAIRLREKMVDGIEQMYSQSTDKDTLARLASILVFYGRQQRAFEILKPLIDAGYKDKEAYKLYLKLAFEHAPPDLDDINYAYYIKLMSADETIGVNEWCDLFVGPCNISFQAFEYEPLRKKYCEKCAKKGNYATKY